MRPPLEESIPNATAEDSDDSVSRRRISPRKRSTASDLKKEEAAAEDVPVNGKTDSEKPDPLPVVDEKMEVSSSDAVVDKQTNGTEVEAVVAMEAAAVSSSPEKTNGVRRKIDEMGDDTDLKTDDVDQLPTEPEHNNAPLAKRRRTTRRSSVSVVSVAESTEDEASAAGTRLRTRSSRRVGAAAAVADDDKENKPNITPQDSDSNAASETVRAPSNVDDAASSSSSSSSSSAVQVKQEVDEETTEVQLEKRSKRPSTAAAIVPMSIIKKEDKQKADRCPSCRVVLSSADVRHFHGHPESAVEEFIALTDPRLSIVSDDEQKTSIDDRPQHKITGYSIYDKQGHLCRFDAGLLEKNVLLNFSGYLKAIYDDVSDIAGGVPAKEMGPINEWFISGYDGGERAVVGFCTEYAEYYLMEPSEEYAPLMEIVYEKIFLSKVTIEYLQDNPEASYEDLLNALEMAPVPASLGDRKISEDSLLQHAQFICEQVQSFDGAGDEQDDVLITSRCIRDLLKLTGVSLGQRRKLRKSEGVARVSSAKKNEWSKATTTPLVHQVFEQFFVGQLDSKDVKTTAPRRKRCGACESCLAPDCGECRSCKDMLKCGGTGKSKQACEKRKCPNMAVMQADDSDMDDYDDEVYSNPNTSLQLQPTMDSSLSKKKGRKSGAAPATANEALPVDPHAIDLQAIMGRVVVIKLQKLKSAEFVGEPLGKVNNKTYFGSIKINNRTLSPGDYIMSELEGNKGVKNVGRIRYLFQDGERKSHMLHVHWFSRGADTILGETADPCELFVVNECGDYDAKAVVDMASVIECFPRDDWSTLGNTDQLRNGHEVELKSDGKSFWYQKSYNCAEARFEDVPDYEALQAASNRKELLEVEPFRFCGSCFSKNVRFMHVQPSLSGSLDTIAIGDNTKEYTYSTVEWKGESYCIGDSVFLTHDAFKFKISQKVEENEKEEKDNERETDDVKYPEYYRKTSDNIKGSNRDVNEPFRVGRIRRLFTAKRGGLATPTQIMVTVTKYYRPENTALTNAYAKDLNLLYWSDEEATVDFSLVMGKCSVAYGVALTENAFDWSQRGPHRFYFNEAFNAADKTFNEPPEIAIRGFLASKGKGKGKGKSSIPKPESTSSDDVEKTEKKFREWPTIDHPLRSLDIFAGCGGLSLGLHQAGVAETLWAVEKDEAAAQAYKLNHNNCTVFMDDCNELLSAAKEGKEKNKRGQKIPQRGEVELIVGGPPCQGFSGMNRFNHRQYSAFKNSLMVTALSFVDFYRPRYILLENVRNFVAFKKGDVLKMTLRCLVQMGYQCTVSIVQAGSYGVPQTRRRAIIMAAAPGERLPQYPAPTHVFKQFGALSLNVDGKRYAADVGWSGESAPLRTVTVRDALHDLPTIANGAKRAELAYGGPPISHFQKLIRGDLNTDESALRDHICKEMAPLIYARFQRIPTTPGSDWRDLPNVDVRLADGTYARKLQYTHNDKKNGRSASGALRGVCPCADGRQCDPVDRQTDTIIPWCLPHTGNRHNHWAGLYGRLEWDGFFSTTVTNPEPMGKQGRVLHPEQHRVVSVRECARSQGFPDSYRFYGTIVEKHRQIGNAVPPPLGLCLGREIRNAVAAATAKSESN